MQAFQKLHQSDFDSRNHNVRPQRFDRLSRQAQAAFVRDGEHSFQTDTPFQMPVQIDEGESAINHVHS
jgi:hypothetical protein